MPTSATQHTLAEFRALLARHRVQPRYPEMLLEELVKLFDWKLNDVRKEIASVRRAVELPGRRLVTAIDPGATWFTYVRHYWLLPPGREALKPWLEAAWMGPKNPRQSTRHSWIKREHSRIDLSVAICCHCGLVRLEECFEPALYRLVDDHNRVWDRAPPCPPDENDPGADDAALTQIGRPVR